MHMGRARARARSDNVGTQMYSSAARSYHVPLLCRHHNPSPTLLSSALLMYIF